MCSVVIGLVKLSILQDGSSLLGERERDLYSAMASGTRYGTKPPPGQQPMNQCTGDMI